MGDFIMFEPKDKSKIVAYPVISLKKCYELYEGTGDMSRVVEKILYSIEHADEVMGISAEDFTQFKKVKDNICLKLMNCESHSVLLKDTPFIPYYDLALVCTFLTKRKDENSMQSIQVRNNYLEMWDVSKEDLFKLAIKNTTDKMQPQIIPMSEILRGIPNFPKRLISRDNMYILSNKERFLGSVCLTFPGVLADIAEKLQSDLYILPSSTHEVIIVPTSANLYDDPEELNQVIHSVNDDIVDPIDQLSDHYYRFDRKSNSLEY